MVLLFVTSAVKTAFAAALLLVAASITLVSVPLRRMWHNTALSIHEDFLRTFQRYCCAIIPLTIFRYLEVLLSADNSALVRSPRFRQMNRDIFVPVTTPEFKAYWFLKERPMQAERTKLDRVVLLWMHGGAYCLGTAGMLLPTFLRVAELAAEQDVSLDILSLEYTLAPEATFPAQQREAVAAYKYLIYHENIDPEQIIIGGESAGGHLAVACLLEIWRQQLPAPMAALLLCPWLNLFSSADSFERNKSLDILDKRALHRCARLAVGQNAYNTHNDLINFSTPPGKTWNWRDVLPRHTWVNVGSQDIFIDDIVAFQANANAEAAVVTLDITEGMHHGWQASVDRVLARQYCDLEPDSPITAGMMPGSENIFSGLSYIFKV